MCPALTPRRVRRVGPAASAAGVYGPGTVRGPASCGHGTTRRPEPAMVRWRFDGQPLLRYATVPDAPVYREIMEIFAQAPAGYTGRLSPEDVHAALSARLDPGGEDLGDDMPTVADVKKRLEHLFLWRNLSHDHDTPHAPTPATSPHTPYLYT